MSDEITHSAYDPRIGVAIAEYLAAIDAQRSLDVGAWLDKHHPVSEQLRAFLRDQSGLGLLASDTTCPEVPSRKVPPRLATGHEVSHYRIVQLLGRGGMGEVYLAYDRALGRPAAIKVLPHDFSSQLRARLLNEAWAIARLQHPAISAFYEAAEAGDQAFIAMEYVVGQTLRERLRRGPLPLDDALAIAVCILEALAHAAAADILHRDLKPENIMLTSDRSAKLLDFGLAKQLVADLPMTTSEASEVAQLGDASLQETREFSAVADSGLYADATNCYALTAQGGVVGTIGYMSPEQLRGKEVDHRSDLFLLGAVLFEMVSGCRAFPGASPQERIQAIFNTPPQRPESSEVSDGLWAILTRALSRNSEDRYQSAAEFLIALRQLGAASPLTDTLAVLDFVNLSEDPTDDWLGQGIAGIVESRLEQVSKIEFIPRPKVLQALAQASGQVSDRELGLRLACRWLVGGTVCRTGASLHATLHLTEVQTGHCAVEATANGNADEWLKLQHRLADAVVKHFDSAITPAAHAAEDLQVFEWVTRGRRLMLQFQKDKQREALELFELAIAREPNCAPALTGLAMAHALRYPYSTDEEDLKATIDYARRAIASDPYSGDAHVWLGYGLLQQDDLVLANAEFIRATELAPQDFMAHYFAASLYFLPTREDYEKVRQLTSLHLPDAGTAWHRAKLEVSLKHYQKSQQLNPFYVGAWIGLGTVHLYLENRTEARWCMERAAQIEQQGATQARGGFIGYLGECLRQCGELEEARKCNLAGLEAVDNTDFIYRDTHRGIFLCSLGRTALQMNDLHSAKVAFLQAVQHLRGRFKARAAGHVLVQALAGLAQADRESAPLDEALDLYQRRIGHDFHPLWFCTNDVSLLSLSMAARALGRDEQAATLLAAAMEAGSVEARQYSQKSIDIPQLSSSVRAGRKPFSSMR